MRGGEKVLEVFCELFPGADLYTLVYLPKRVSPTVRQMAVTTSFIDRLPWAKQAYRYYLPLFPTAIEHFELSRYDLIVSSNHCVAKGIVPHRAFHIAYMHAPMRYVWDQYDAYFGADSSSISRAGMMVWRRYLQRWDIRSSERVDYFVANSNNVARKIKNVYGRESDVIYPPVDIKRFQLGERLDPGYYLIVSALVPYKRIDLAVDVFNGIRLPLKIVGDGPLRRLLERRAHSNIEFLGWVNDASLSELYSRCEALVFPGEEDFGIVPLEAQASGRPVIAYGKGGALETVVPLESGGGAPATGIFFTEQTVESLLTALQFFQKNRQRFEPTAIRQHACRFSRERFKTQISDYISARLRERAADKKNHAQAL